MERWVRQLSSAQGNTHETQLSCQQESSLQLGNSPQHGRGFCAQTYSIHYLLPLSHRPASGVQQSMSGRVGQPTALPQDWILP